MLVKNWMSRDVITIDQGDSMLDATNTMKEKGIRMLPVMDKDKLVGVVTDRDLKSASASDASTLEIHELLYLISKIKMKDVMTSDPYTVHEDFTMEETADLMLRNTISHVPVVNSDDGLVGVISQTDIFRALISLTGLTTGGGIQFGVKIEDRPGSIKDVTDVIRKYGGRMASILSSYENVPSGYRKVYIRSYEIDRHHLSDLLEEIKTVSTLLYYIDHSEDKRVIY